MMQKGNVLLNLVSTDEMNLFFPQSVQATIELEEIADAKKQLITPTTSEPIIGIVQDGLLGAYNMTQDDVKFDWRTAMNLLAFTTFDDNDKIEKGKDISGKELFSLIVPQNINVSLKKDGIDFEMEDGEIIRGSINGDLLGPKKMNNLLQNILNEHGEDAVKNFIDNIQRLTNRYNLLSGFTAGIGDTFINYEAEKELGTYLKTLLNSVEIDITKIENNPDYMESGVFENKIYKDMNVARDDSTKIIVNNVNPDNNFLAMMKSGSKGGATNLGQMVGCIGLQVFNGKLYDKEYLGRTLPYFHENDDRGPSRGFIKSSYINGMNFPEFFFHTSTGRDGSIDGAVKTSETGYTQRKLVKTMEDIMMKCDGTIRMANNQIIQYVYGGNGVDTIKQHQYKINMLKMNNKELIEDFKFTKDELKKYNGFTEKDNDELYNKIKNMRDKMRNYIIDAIPLYNDFDNTIMLPINLSRIVKSILLEIKKKKSTGIKKSKDLTPQYILKRLNEILDIESTQLLRVKKDEMKREIVILDEMVSKFTLMVGLFDSMNPKAILEKYNLNLELFEEIIEKIKDEYFSSLIESGEMIGVIAAQSLGEAVTQMTLNSFHSAGLEKMAGAARINELVSATKNPKDPQMYIFLTEEFSSSKETANKIGRFLEKTTFGDIRGELTVYYENNPRAIGNFMEQDGIGEPFYSKKMTKNNCQASIDNLPWLIRVEMDKEKMLEKGVSLLDIKTKFCTWWDVKHVNAKKKKEKNSSLKNITSFAMLSNTDNDFLPVIHIRFNVKDLDKTVSKKKKSKFDRQSLKDFIELIDKFKLKGMEGIDKLDKVVTDKRHIFEEDGTMKKIDEEKIWTFGVNMKDIRHIVGIDCYRTYTDNIQTMFNTFGIEVARHRLMNEFRRVYKGSGNYVNPQHISLLVDTMCYDGVLSSADRHGMKKANIDPLSKASFEKTIDILQEASVFGMIDKMNGVSANIAAGQIIKGGTCYSELLLNLDMIINSEYVEKDIEIKHERSIASTILEKENDDMYIPE
jgi:DNA-directed RNA polymerase II subunit RPB1